MDARAMTVRHGHSQTPPVSLRLCRRFTPAVRRDCHPLVRHPESACRLRCLSRRGLSACGRPSRRHGREHGQSDTHSRSPGHHHRPLARPVAPSSPPVILRPGWHLSLRMVAQSLAVTVTVRLACRGRLHCRGSLRRRRLRCELRVGSFSPRGLRKWGVCSPRGPGGCQPDHSRTTVAGRSGNAGTAASGPRGASGSRAPGLNLSPAAVAASSCQPFGPAGLWLANPSVVG